MFDTLIESRQDAGRSAKSGAFFGVTTFVLTSFFLAIFVWSLYSVGLNLGEEDLALNTLVAPVPVPDTAPPPPAPENKPQKAASEDAPKNFDVIQNPVENLNQPTQPPEKSSSEKSNATQVRPGVNYIEGAKTQLATGGGESGPQREGGGEQTQAIKVQPKQVEQEEAAPGPAPKPTPTPAPPKPSGPVSGGVVNGKATNLVKPPYPAAAKAVRASGAVNVQVLIDENGNVVSASATSGHPLLRAAAVSAARSSKFSPTKLSGQSVKVTGVIVYNFVPQ